MAEVLLGDIGGTNSRLAFAGRNGRPERIMAIPNDSVSGIEAAIHKCLDGDGPRPRAAVLAFAAPVEGDEIALTNRPWRFRIDDLRQRFGLVQLRALNDFEALAWALPRLAPGDSMAIGPAREPRTGPKLVLGPGTGMGVAALIPGGDGWHVVASEGGHVSFGPASAEEDTVFTRLRKLCGGPVSAEMILSGGGLVRLHQALHPGTEPTTSQAIAAQARSGAPAELMTVRMFVRLLGRFAGDMALTFRATGGVFLAGGVALGLGSLLDGAIFRPAFEAHRPYERLLAAIPTALITYSEPGLLGCAAVADRLLTEP